MHMQRENGRVTRKSKKEKEVRMRAQTPGPSGSATWRKKVHKQNVSGRDVTEQNVHIMITYLGLKHIDPKRISDKTYWRESILSAIFSI